MESKVIFQCEYATQKQLIVVTNSSLAEVPKKLFDTFSNANNVTLSGCGIKHINRYCLDQASRLQTLNLSSNFLEELPGFAFSGANSLRTLDLAWNNISIIDPTAFNTLTELVVLNLSGNRLRQLDGNVFAKLKALNKIFLGSNELQVIERDLFRNNARLEIILLHQNLISIVEEGAFATNRTTQPTALLELISLNYNNITMLNLENVKVKRLWVSNNTLERVYLSRWIETMYADNNRISSIQIDSPVEMQLRTLGLRNNSITSFDTIGQLASLKELDLTDNTLGPLSLTSLAKLSNLERLVLERTFISNLQHGTFSQQTKLTYLDLSYNNLDRFDLDILISSTELRQLFLDGNRLKALEFEHLKRIFPSLVNVGLTDNNFNCSYLSKIIRHCNENAIVLFQPSDSSNVLDRTNVKGMYCYDDKNPLRNLNGTVHQLTHHLLNDSFDDLQAMLQSVLDDVRRFSENHASASNKTSQLESTVNDLTQNQFILQKDLNSLRQSLFEVRLALLSNRTNGSTTVGNDELRRMIETANNLTLDKQELSAKTLEFKIYEQSFKVDKALELARENAERLTMLGKRVEQWIGNIVGSGGPGLFAQPSNERQHSGGYDSTARDNGNGLIVAVLVMVCLVMVVLVYALFRANRRSLDIVRKRYTHRDSSMTTMVENDI
ncbi:protein artichoke-like [Anopheles nili]|uniref:protein artichoke-like n=1 Tax=Anopheles nili TaxID=185578 RepID=UPI00237AF285|nr:protein artichoke-like [Anopheles nili]